MMDLSTLPVWCHDWPFVNAHHAQLFAEKYRKHPTWNAQEPAAQSAFEKLRIPAVEHEKMHSLSLKLCTHDYPSRFPLASTMTRRATVILGPTNSGKTHRALELLGSAPTGVYLGPLRLLALEVHERMNAQGKLCSLRTGEEQVLVPGATYMASTIETMDANIPLSCAVLDEMQMIVDPERGWAWTQALVGCPAEHLVLLGSMDVWPILKPLLQRLGIEYDTVWTNRLQPLRAQKYAIRIQDAEPGDAYVVFSRKDVFFYQELLAKQGLSTAVVYGALGPEVRRSEAERFRNGQAKVLIATDAIGMGLNLPIRRVVFTTMSKFNGEDTVPIPPSLVKQIAGRAGRFGHFEEGHVTALDSETLAYVHSCLNRSTKLDNQNVAVAPTVDQLKTLASEMHYRYPSQAMRAWRHHVLQKDDHFCAATMADRIALTERIEEMYPLMPFEVVARASMAPLPNVYDFEQLYLEWLSALGANAPATTWTMDVIHHATMEQYEFWYFMASLYCWLGLSYPQAFPDVLQASNARMDIASQLIVRLQQRARARIQAKKSKPRELRTPHAGWAAR